MCVRYRYDLTRRKRFKTVELLVAERDWPPPIHQPASDRLVAVPIAFGEVALRRRVKEAGGTRNPERRAWELRYDRAVMLGLADRIASAGPHEAPSI